MGIPTSTSPAGSPEHTWAGQVLGDNSHLGSWDLGRIFLPSSWPRQESSSFPPSQLMENLQPGWEKQTQEKRLIPVSILSLLLGKGMDSRASLGCCKALLAPSVLPVGTASNGIQDK